MVCTGLGLSIVNHVLNQHDGQLRISSELGMGSVLTCDFLRELRMERTAISDRDVTDFQ